MKTVSGVAMLLCASLSLAVGVLENPQPISIQTGIGTISGWYCPKGAPGTLIQMQIDSGALVQVPHGSLRGDTQAACGRVDTGFAYLLNYNTLAPGNHTIRVFADGAQFASAMFATMKPAGEFVSGVDAGYWLNNFPVYGKRSHVDWSEAKQNFSITATDANYTPVGGRYFGSTVYTAVGCTAANRNGYFFENAKFTVNYPSNLTILAEYAANYSCTYVANPVVMNDGTLSVASGTFSCTTGGRGTWTSSRIVTALDGLTAQISLRFTAGDTCRVDGTVGGARAL